MPELSESIEIAHPLDEFYARSGLPMPPLKRLPPAELPEPYRSLLVHQNDMTSTLENFHGASVHLRVISRERRHQDYFREVVLELDGNNKPVEFGAIKINLELFPARAQEQILREHHPLGRILRDCELKYQSRPEGYLRITSDETINRLLGLQDPQALFGRHNLLLDRMGRRLAEIVEILPPEPAAQP